MSHPEWPEVAIVRHGETAWSISGQHTGRTDIPLTPRGERDAQTLRGRLDGIEFDAVFTSPLQRASKTCALAGFGDRAEAEPGLAEWDYGDYEGLTSAEIHRHDPDWVIYRDGCPGGESVEAITARVDRVVARLKAIGGRTLVFTHGHLGRVLAARWLGLPLGEARMFVLGTAALSVLGHENSLDRPVIRLWNDDRHVLG